VIVAATIAAGSIALASFRIDVLINIFISVGVIWQLTGANQQRERQALHLIGGAFFALALYRLGQTAYIFREP